MSKCGTSLGSCLILIVLKETGLKSKGGVQAVLGDPVLGDGFARASSFLKEELLGLSSLGRLQLAQCRSFSNPSPATTFPVTHVGSFNPK